MGTEESHDMLAFVLEQAWKHPVSQIFALRSPDPGKLAVTPEKLVLGRLEGRIHYSQGAQGTSYFQLLQNNIFISTTSCLIHLKKNINAKHCT